MEIDLKKEESTETSEFIKFSIREYVAEIRKKYPKKCWPFGSLGDPDKYEVFSLHQSLKSTFLSSQNCPSYINGTDDTPQLTDSPNYMVESLGTGSKIGKVVDNGSIELTSGKVNNGQNDVDEGVIITHNVGADNDEAEMNRPRRKHQKFRLLSDIYKDPASKLRAGCDITNPENVNRSFVTDIEDDDDDEDDDVTLSAYFRKQKGAEITDLKLKKRNITRVEEVKIDQDKKSKHGFKDSYMDKDFRLKCSQKSKQLAEVSCKKGTENEDSEMAVVMLLARHFNEKKQVLCELETNPNCACAKKKIRKRSTESGKRPITKTSSKTAIKHPVMKITKENFTPVCSFNRNPADFSTPNAENKFMRRD